MDETVVFRTKRLASWGNALGYLLTLVFAVATVLVGAEWLGIVLATFLLFFAVTERHDFYQHVEISADDIRVQRLLGGPFFLALGAVGLINDVYGVVHKVRLDEEGVRLWVGWWSRYLAWTEIEEAAVHSNTVRLRGAGTKITFCPGYFAKRRRIDVEKAVQYYVVLHDIPVSHKQFLLP